MFGGYGRSLARSVGTWVGAFLLLSCIIYRSLAAAHEGRNWILAGGLAPAWTVEQWRRDVVYVCATLVRNE